LGVATNTVSRWETAVYRPTIEDLDKLARFFGKSILEFFPKEEVRTKRDEKIDSLLRTAKQLKDADVEELRRYAEFRRRVRTVSFRGARRKHSAWTSHLHQTPGGILRGATVNRELECLKCVLDLAVKRKYKAENPALEVSHFNELRERPVRRMLTVEEELRILEAAPPYLRVAMILLTQTGGRTYSEGFSLRWNQVDLEHRVIRLDNTVKTPGSVEPIPLSDYACEVLKAWRKEQASTNPFVFPSPIRSDRPISTVKTVWKSTLKRAGVPHFPLYNLRHVFCTRLSGVAPDAVVQRAMRHTSPETKRRYQLGMADQVRKAVEEANKSTYGKKNVLRFYYGQPQTDDGQQNAAAN
jgi:integrase